jgi:hypothetical protein
MSKGQGVVRFYKRMNPPDSVLRFKVSIKAGFVQNAKRVFNYKLNNYLSPNRRLALTGIFLGHVCLFLDHILEFWGHFENKSKYSKFGFSYIAIVF